MQCMDLKTGQNLPHGAGVPCVAALGNFDGVHLGHRAILHATTTLAKQHSLVPAVFTFATHPKQAPLLCTNEERLEHMRACGIRFVYLYDFPSLQHNSPQTFVRDILIKEMQTQIAVSGENFHFGENGDGTTETLQQAMQTAGKETYVVPMVYAYGDTVSSTRIRALLARGEIQTANHLLGYPYTLSGNIIHGLRNGHKMQIPTINFQSPNKLLPARGVYVSNVYIEQHVTRGVTNVGIRPTIRDGQEKPNVETHLLDIPPQTDLYGKKADVVLLQYLRPEQTFDNLELLKQQINRDICAAREYREETER